MSFYILVIVQSIGPRMKIESSSFYHTRFLFQSSDAAEDGSAAAARRHKSNGGFMSLEQMLLGYFTLATNLSLHTAANISLVQENNILTKCHDVDVGKTRQDCF